MHSYLVSLRISGKTLNPSEITSELGVEPTQIRAKGQPRPGGNSVWDESMWEYEAKPSSGERDWRSLEQGLHAVLSIFVSRQRTLREYQQRFKVCLFCGLNRYEAEEEEALQRRSSDPLGPEFCVGHREVHGEA